MTVSTTTSMGMGLLACSTLARRPRRFFHQRAQAFDSAIPLCRDSLDERACADEPALVEDVEYLPTAPFVSHEAGAFEHLQMLHDGLPRDFGAARQRRRRQRSAGSELLHDGKARSVAKREKHVR